MWAVVRCCSQAAVAGACPVRPVVPARPASTYQACVVREFGGPDVMQTEPVVASSKPLLKGQVQIRLWGAGVNPADTYIRSGAYNHLPDLPWTPGLEGSGVVTALHGCSTGLALGDHVMACVVADTGGLACTTGLYAEQTNVDEHLVTKLPKVIDLELAAAVPVSYFTAYRALVRLGGLRGDDTVLVHGASGGVGIAAVQLARMLHPTCRIIGTASSQRGRDLVLAAGADMAVSHSEPGYMDQVCTYSTPTLVVEMLADKNLNVDLDCTAVGARVILVGCRGTIEINPRVIMAREATVQGCFLWNETIVERQAAASAITEGLVHDALYPPVGSKWALADARKAHTEGLVSLNGQQGGAVGKVLLSMV